MTGFPNLPASYERVSAEYYETLANPTYSSLTESIVFDEVVYGRSKPVPEGVVALARLPADGSEVVNNNHFGHRIPFPAGNVVAIKTTRKRNQFSVAIALLEPAHPSSDMWFAENAPWPKLLDSSFVNPQKFLWVLKPLGLLASPEKFDRRDGFNAQ